MTQRAVYILQTKAVIFLILCFVCYCHYFVCISTSLQVMKVWPLTQSFMRNKNTDKQTNRERKTQYAPPHRCCWTQNNTQKCQTMLWFVQMKNEKIFYTIAYKNYYPVYMMQNTIPKCKSVSFFIIVKDPDKKCQRHKFKVLPGIYVWGKTLFLCRYTIFKCRLPNCEDQHETVGIEHLPFHVFTIITWKYSTDFNLHTLLFHLQMAQSCDIC